MRSSILAVVLCAALAGCSASAANPETARPGQTQLEQALAILAGKTAAPPEQAVVLLTRAAELGHGEAQNTLALMYLTGAGVAQDDGLAARWLAQAAESQVADAQSNLGTLYLNGRGVPRDTGKAAELLRQAAAKGVSAAQHNLGWMAQMGEGMPKRLDEAVRWYGIAAESGYAQSQYNLGVLLAEGDGIGLDMPQAVKWLSLAGLSARPEIRRQATERLVEVSKTTPPAVVAEGLAEARHWLATRRGH